MFVIAIVIFAGCFEPLQMFARVALFTMANEIRRLPVFLLLLNAIFATKHILLIYTYVYIHTYMHTNMPIYICTYKHWVSIPLSPANFAVPFLLCSLQYSPLLHAAFYSQKNLNYCVAVVALPFAIFVLFLYFVCVHPLLYQYVVASKAFNIQNVSVTTFIYI